MEETMPHSLTLNERQQMVLTGVEEVLSFDETAAMLRTSLGTLMIRGRELKLRTLSLDGGQMTVNGQVDALAYEQTGGKSGWLGRLLG